MYEFETFGYLDVQKTASTFIASVFEQYCTEDEVKKTKHGGLARGFDQSKFYFISVRDPLDQYISLYSYGCEGKGQLFGQLSSKGLAGLYDGTWSGFENWLKYVLKPANCFLFERGYHAVAKWIGLQSYRALRLAVPSFPTESKHCHSKNELRWLYEETNVIKYVIRYDTLKEDLCFLLTNKLNYCMLLPEAVEYVRDMPPINSSQRIDCDIDNPKLRTKAKRLLKKREWLLKKVIGTKSAKARVTNEKEISPDNPSIRRDSKIVQ